MTGGESVPRRHEAEVRRAQASQFVSQISQWLQEQALDDKVASIAITALGQVLITCEKDIISRIQEDDSLSIANIRSGATLTGSVQRIANW